MNEEEEAMKNLMGRFSMSVTLLGVLFLAIAALAPRADAATPCCSITSIDVKTGLATAKDTATGQTFQFKVTDAALLNLLKVGQGVYANFKTRQVSVNGADPCCSIVSLGKPGGLGNTPARQTPQAGVPQSAPIGPGKLGGGRPQLTGTAQIDPCTLASADALKLLLQGGLQKYFPYSVNNEGEHIKISDPTIEQVSCPHMRIEMKAHVQYRQTRGFPQYETGGTLKIDSPLVAKVQYQKSTGGNEAVTASNFVRAAAMLTNPSITSLQIDNVPGWLTPSWIRDCLNGKYSNWGCHDILHQMSFDVTNLVKLYLEQGNTIATSSPAPNTKPSGFPPIGSSQPGTAPQIPAGETPQGEMAPQGEIGPDPGFPPIGSSQPGTAPQIPAGETPQGEMAPQGEIGPDPGFGDGQYGDGQYGGGQYGQPGYQEQRTPVDPNELTGKIPGMNPTGGAESGGGYSIQGDRPWYEKNDPTTGNFNNNNNFNNNPNNFNNNPNNFNNGGYNNFNSGTEGGFQQDTSMPSN